MNEFKKEIIETLKEHDRQIAKLYDIVIDIYTKLIELQRQIYERKKNI